MEGVGLSNDTNRLLLQSGTDTEFHQINSFYLQYYIVVKYVAEVHTGNKRGSGTDANVQLCVYGLLGDTGDRPLENSSTNRNKFERGNVRINNVTPEIFSLVTELLNYISSGVHDST